MLLKKKKYPAPRSITSELQEKQGKDRQNAGGFSSKRYELGNVIRNDDRTFVMIRMLASTDDDNNS